MTDIDPNTLPMATSGKTLNRVVGTQLDSDGLSTFVLYPIQSLSISGGRISKISANASPPDGNGNHQITLNVYTDDGETYTAVFSLPSSAPGKDGDDGKPGASISSISAEQGDVIAGQSSTVKLTFSLDNGSALAPVTMSLPPGEGLTVTKTEVTQASVVEGQPSKVDVTLTMSNNTQSTFSFNAPPGANGAASDSSQFLPLTGGEINGDLSVSGKLSATNLNAGFSNLTLGYGDGYRLELETNGDVVSYDKDSQVQWTLNKSVLDKSDLATLDNLSTEIGDRKEAISGVETKIVTLNNNVSDIVGRLFPFLYVFQNTISSDKKPTIMYIKAKYDGGASSYTDYLFPESFGGWVEPYFIAVSSASITQEDWDAGKTSTYAGAGLDVSNISNKGFRFQHAPGWIGNVNEFMFFLIIGFAK